MDKDNNTLQDIAHAAIDSMGGGGGLHKFFDRQLELLPDHDLNMLAGKLRVALPEYADKLHRPGQFERWFLSRLVEHLWYPKIDPHELAELCQNGINEPTITPNRLWRGLKSTLKKFVPNYVTDIEYEDDGKKIEMTL